MAYYWYIRRRNELFGDLDLTLKSRKRLLLARARLRGAKRANALAWERYFFFQSESKFHYHLMVKLEHEIDPFLQLLWESRICDDLYRNNLNFARQLKFNESWSLLISPMERRSYWRPPDHVCNCPAKHKADVIRDCPVAKKLTGCTLSADHFGDPIEEPDKLILGRGCEW